jgi:biopolymer transport protein ExbB
MEFIARGGIFMYPIIACSVIAMAVFFERLWTLRRISVIPKKFIHSIEDLLKKNKISEALFLCQSNNSSISRIFQAGLKNAGKGMWFVKESIEERGGREAIILEKHIGILSTVAHLTP